MIWGPVFGALIALGFIVATWDDDNTWKVITVAIMMVVGAMGARAVSYSNGYDKGFDQGSCLSYVLIDAKPNVEIAVPERCSDE